MVQAPLSNKEVEPAALHATAVRITWDPIPVVDSRDKQSQKDAGRGKFYAVCLDSHAGFAATKWPQGGIC